MHRLLPLAILLTSTLAFANPPTPTAEASVPTLAQVLAEKAVQTNLVQPLAAKEVVHSRFSRAWMPPQTRRVRVLDVEPKKDGQGVAFLSFAIDTRHGFAALEDGEGGHNGWRKDTLTGCVYIDSGQVFVKLGDNFLPAAVLMGKRAPAPASNVCKSADVQLANK